MKFLGSMCFGLLAMFAAVYWMGRTVNQRKENFATMKSLASRVFTSVKNYCHDLLNPAPETEAAKKA